MVPCGTCGIFVITRSLITLEQSIPHVFAGSAPASVAVWPVQTQPMVIRGIVEQEQQVLRLRQHVVVGRVVGRHPVRERGDRQALSRVRRRARRLERAVVDVGRYEQGLLEHGSRRRDERHRHHEHVVALGVADDVQLQRRRQNALLNLLQDANQVDEGGSAAVDVAADRARRLGRRERVRK